ncbi:MAG: class II histone deacetylase [Hyphomicrobiales bacterium]
MAQDRMLVVWHDLALAHDTGEGVFEGPPSDMLAHQMKHPENAERVANMKRSLEKGPAAPFIDWRPGRLATAEEIIRVHDHDYYAELLAAEAMGGRSFSGSTVFGRHSLDPIRAAAGSALVAVDAILGGETKMAYALVRPPGHHAQPTRADGYCFVNNAAVAAQRALDAGVERVAIIDWDVHHGNGTQECFYDRDDVLTISLHMHHGSWGPSHPQTGEPDETGTGKGKGFNVNIDLPLGLGDETYRAAFEEIVAPKVDAFRPGLIIIANGQDANQFDPNGRQLVTTKGFHTLGAMARELAARHTGGKLLSVQEGGYNPAYAALCAHATVEGFLGLERKTPDPIAYMPEDVALGKSAVRALKDRLL